MIMYTKKSWGYKDESIYKRWAIKNTLGDKKSMESLLFRLSKEAVRQLTNDKISIEHKENIVRGYYIFSPSYLFGPIEFDPNYDGVYIPGVEPGTWWSSREYDWIKFKLSFESKAMQQLRNIIISKYPEVIPDIKNTELSEIVPFKFGKDDI